MDEAIVLWARCKRETVPAAAAGLLACTLAPMRCAAPHAPPQASAAAAEPVGSAASGSAAGAAASQPAADDLGPVPGGCLATLRTALARYVNIRHTCIHVYMCV